jgi:hypothetical protein
MSSQDRHPDTAIVPLLAPDEQLPSGPLWMVLDADADGDGVVVASQSDQRVALTARAMTTWGTATLLRLSPAAARAAAAALLAAADDTEHPETAR